jgi:hypothetical protein
MAGRYAMFPEPLRLSLPRRSVMKPSAVAPNNTAQRSMIGTFSVHYFEPFQSALPVFCFKRRVTTRSKVSANFQ